MHPLFSCAGERAYETISCFSKTASVLRNLANGRFSLFADAAGAWYSQRLIDQLRQLLRNDCKFESGLEGSAK
jgi:hypothetical protein